MPGWGRRSSWRGSTITSRSGTAPPGARTWTRSKGVPRMFPSVLQPSATDHVPVLADEVRQLLAIEPGETVVDATFGAGGHASLLAADLRGKGRLIAIDRDPDARAYFDRFRKQTGVPGRFLRGDFAIVLEQLADNGARTDAILFDLGVSSMQIDRPERGFSYAADAPLDMRMDPSADYSARELVNEASERELVRIFRQFGEERYAKQIARAIVRRRKQEPFERTGELVDVIKAAIPAPARFGEGHPAKRVFQALRIEVNDELGSLERALPAALKMLRPGGRLGVISFHSLEDRIVKGFLRREEQGCTCPPDFPVCVCGSEPTMRATPRRAVRPTAAEVARNPRAQSARPRLARAAPPPPHRDEGRVTMASLSHAQAATVDPVARPRPRTRTRKKSQPRTRGGILWIVVSGILLAGVVFVNVAVLQLNLSLDSTNSQRTKLIAQNAAL